jgi:hypothetical protein
MKWLVLLLFLGVAAHLYIARRRRSLLYALQGGHQIVDEAHVYQNDEDATDALFLTFSAEEIGKIAVLIITGIERKAAIPAMPRYTKTQHKDFALFYDRLKGALDIGRE